MKKINFMQKAKIFIFWGATIFIFAMTLQARTPIKETEIKKSLTLNQNDFLAQPKANQFLANLPIAFIENKGQWDPRVKFLARQGPMSAYLEKDAIVLNHPVVEEEQSRNVSVRLSFENSNDNVSLSGKDLNSAKYNYFIGQDSQNWTVNVPSFKAVTYDNLYNGVDLVVHQSGNHLEYDLVVEPRADLKQVMINVEGAEGMAYGEDNTLIIRTALGDLKQSAPKTWQVLPSGQKELIEARFLILDDSRYQFTVPDRDMDLAMVIDPGLEWSTYFGGGSTIITVVKINESGEIVIAGSENSPTFPATVAPYGNPVPGDNMFISKLTADGSSLLSSVVIGGNDKDVITGLAFDQEGNYILTGYSHSYTFPITSGAYDTHFNGNSSNPDGILAKVSSDLSSLEYSSYVGFINSKTTIYSPVIDQNGHVVVVGETTSSTFPTTAGAFDTTSNGTLDGVVMKFDLNAVLPVDQLLYSSYLGGSGSESFQSLVYDPSSDTFIMAGTTNSPNFPVTLGAYDTLLANSTDVVVVQMKLDNTLPAEEQLVYSTFLGGSDTELFPALALLRENEVIVSASSLSSNYPTTAGAYDTTFNGGFFFGDIGISHLKLDPALGNDQLAYSTYLGGAGDEYSTFFSHASGTVTIVGGTDSSDFPATDGAYSTMLTPPSGFFTGDAFISRIRLDGNGEDDLLYSTYLGGGGVDRLHPYTVLDDGSVIVVGITTSADFPVTSGAFDTTFGGISGFISVSDGLVAKLDMQPTGILSYGQPSSGGSEGCGDNIAMGVSDMPVEGTNNFRFNVTGAPSNTNGFLVLGTQKASQTIKTHGATLLIQPTQPLVVLPVTSDDLGYSETITPIPAGWAGVKIYGQYIWVNKRDCGGPGKWSGSTALEMTIQ